MSFITLGLPPLFTLFTFASAAVGATITGRTQRFQTCNIPGMGRVAIIDDSEDALELFAVILRGHHEFVTFSSGPDFLKEFRPGKFDLVLLDLVMPVMDGFEVFHRIHSMDENVPVVAITAMAQPAEKKKALQAGFCDYFVKPIMQIEKFRKAVYSHVGECANPPYDPSKPAA